MRSGEALVYGTYQIVMRLYNFLEKSEEAAINPSRQLLITSRFD